MPKLETRKSKIEIRLMVIPAQAGIHKLTGPRFLGGDFSHSEFRFSNFEFRVSILPSYS
jgi:hypothetical protein